MAIFRCVHFSGTFVDINAIHGHERRNQFRRATVSYSIHYRHMHNLLVLLFRKTDHITTRLLLAYTFDTSFHLSSNAKLVA